MASPLFLSAQYVGTTLSVYFNRAITATLSQELNGFTVELNGSPLAVTFNSINNNALRINLPGAPVPSDVLTVEYDGAGTIVDAATATDPALAFGPATAIETADPATAYQAVIQPNNTLTVFFNEPVASTDNDLITGVVVTVDSVGVSLIGTVATLAADLRSITYVFPFNLTYTDVVEFEYDGLGTLYSWPSGALAAFTLTAFNLSTDGLPTSAYPLSYISKYAIVPENSVAKPRLGVSLNPVDIRLVSEFGPARVTTGGIFGITLTNPLGISVAGKLVDVVDGADITQHFSGAYSAADIYAAAVDWQNVMVVRIGLELGRVRAAGQSITPTSTVIVQV